MPIKLNLSKSFLKEIVQNEFEEEIEIIDIHVSHLVPPGENYNSELFRIVINYSEKNRNNNKTMPMIVKRFIQNGFLTKCEEEMGFFTCELSMYNEILPIINELVSNKQISPKAYYVSEGIEKMLILEDITVLNHNVVKRQEGLDLEHCLMAFKKLAYFHSASLAVYEKNAQVVEKYNKGIFFGSSSCEKYISVTFQDTVKACRRKSTLQKYASMIDEKLIKKLSSATQRDPIFNVLNHGDFWVNNLMFQYNEDDTLKDVLFIDYQTSIFASPFFDIHYFLATSTSLEVMKHHVTTILNYYYDELCKHVQTFEIKGKIPNSKDFNKSFYDNAFMGLAAVCFALPCVKADGRKDANIDNFLGDDAEGNFRHHCFNNINYLNAIEFLLPFYESCGAFQ